MSDLLAELDAIIARGKSLSPNLIGRDALLSSCADRIRELEAAIRDLFHETEWPDGGDLDGFAFQEWAEKHGFLRAEERDSFCAEDCNCAEYHGHPGGGFTCYRKAAWLLAAAD